MFYYQECIKKPGYFTGLHIFCLFLEGDWLWQEVIQQKGKETLQVEVF